MQHGLSPHADVWVAHCEAQVAGWRSRGHDVSLHVARLAGRPRAGESTEAWAREARYHALTRLARTLDLDLVLLAHHRRDQAETLLLQALRGGGLAGLAAMPRSAVREGINWARPWLDRPREDIEAYLRHHRLAFVDDDSNADARLARNRLRLQVWPALQTAFPAAEAVLADTARWAQQGAEALAELAAIDLAALVDAAGTLELAAWAALSPARRVNALRTWLAARAGQAAPASLVQRLGNELAASRDGSWPCPPGHLRLHRGRLHWQRDATTAQVPAVSRADTLSVRRAGRYRLPGWGGVLEVRRVDTGGVPLAALARLEFAERRGGERFQAGPGRPPRSLKKQYQAAGVPAWQREGPLVCSGGVLLFVPGLGLDARALAAPGEPQASLGWRPDPHQGRGVRRRGASARPALAPSGDPVGAG